MLHFIEGNGIGLVWVQSIKTVLQYGMPINDDKGTILEISPLFIQINHPSEADAIVQQYGDEAILLYMQQNFEDQSFSPGWGYSYAERLYGDQHENPIAQIIKRLQQYPSTKSATISLLKPEEDGMHTPCLATLDFKIRQNRMNINAFFRSQDIGKKMYADMVQLLRLGKKVAKELQLDDIRLYSTICSAHIYEKDICEMQRIVSHFT